LHCSIALQFSKVSPSRCLNGAWSCPLELSLLLLAVVELLFICRWIWMLYYYCESYYLFVTSFALVALCTVFNTILLNSGTWWLACCDMFFFFQLRTSFNSFLQFMDNWLIELIYINMSISNSNDNEFHPMSDTKFKACSDSNSISLLSWPRY
jgi:hypothetical protein